VAPAKLIIRQKWTDEQGNLYEIVLWRVERNARHPEGVRYRLAFIRAGEEVPAILYDNHHPKGHHRHISGRQVPYTFVTATRLVADFLAEAIASAGEAR
jgi:hypothetical protein